MTDAEQLAARTAADPHSYLGAHPDGNGGVVVRAFRPAARAVHVLLAGGARADLAAVGPEGVFEGKIDGASLPLDYELEVEYADDRTYTVGDPYRFLPTLGDVDLHLVGEGRHEELYEKLGAHVIEHQGVGGTAFAVWAPSARAVSVVGDFNSWDGRLHPMRSLGSSGVWELFLPGVGAGTNYKYEILARAGELRLKADPVAFATELPPKTASVVFDPEHEWGDEDWVDARAVTDQLKQPISIYEVHLGSWRLNPLEGNRSLTYLELADELSAYAKDMGFTHIELLPVMAHPFSGSWGYQVTGYFAPTPRYGTPDEFRAFVDRLHQNGLGVILDWVPAHFPRDDFALARFDGSALYEHQDPRRGAHPDWGTLVFNYGRNEVRNFLLANALFWLREYHADGIRVDAVASMLYLDYSREEGEWVPNQFGGNEDLEAVAFLKEYNEVVYAREPGVISAAEESTAWPGVSRPTYLGGLGFGFKWNMGWMHDTLAYFAARADPPPLAPPRADVLARVRVHRELILPLSHDEVVHGKGSMLTKMPGDRWQQFANLRALYAFMWAHPGKKLLFMGNEIAQEQEWSEERSLDWHLLEAPGTPASSRWSATSTTPTATRPRCTSATTTARRSGGWSRTTPRRACSRSRGSARTPKPLVFIANLTPIPREGYRVGLPVPGRWRELINTDARYGGSGLGNLGGVDTEDVPWMSQYHSAVLTLPPLGAIWLTPEPASGPGRPADGAVVAEVGAAVAGGDLDAVEAPAALLEHRKR